MQNTYSACLGQCFHEKCKTPRLLWQGERRKIALLGDHDGDWQERHSEDLGQVRLSGSDSTPAQ